MARKIYDESFKKKAVELSTVRGSVPEVAIELGINSHMLYRWCREHERYAHNSFPGRGNPKMTDQEKEIFRLKSELREMKMERDILKKAISIFSVSDKRSSGL